MASSSLKAGSAVFLPFFINATDLAAGTGQELIAPCDGVITEVAGTAQAAIGTGGDITVKTGDALGTTVAGATLTFADSAAAGTRKTAEATAGSATRVVAKGDRIQIVPAAAFATSGAVNGYLRIDSADTSPALPAA